ncbi:hypothetical protein Xish_03024 [Xenorhabdus ishibashii]|uniref:Uncharacterized protein n=1 Tax=Xenorhabdus ishibashii TaxID=1034471 RepID=A0A2D0KJY7_9GAMM|nr:hypothetical protein Xish_03024 [Xenorhabdus ishibashii]
MLKFNNLILSEILPYVFVNIGNFNIKFCNYPIFFNEFGYYYISDMAIRDYLNFSMHFVWHDINNLQLTYALYVVGIGVGIRLMLFLVCCILVANWFRILSMIVNLFMFLAYIWEENYCVFFALKM